MSFIDIIRWVLLIMEVSVVILLCIPVVFRYTILDYTRSMFGVFLFLILIYLMYSPICIMHFIIMLIRLLAYGRPFTAIDAIHIIYIVAVTLLVIREKIINHRRISKIKNPYNPRKPK